MKTENQAELRKLFRLGKYVLADFRRGLKRLPLKDVEDFLADVARQRIKVEEFEEVRDSLDTLIDAISSFEKCTNKVLDA